MEADLKPTLMAGDYGPDPKMATAIAAYTPNVPWARFGEPSVVDFDGTGTSAATPQVAAAAALWIQKHRTAYDAYAEGWMRVEAVRKGLFDGAAADPARKGYLGVGQLKARNALDALPAAATALNRQAEDHASYAAFKLLFGMGIAAAPHPAMLELELRQIAQATGLETRLLDAMTRASKPVWSMNCSRCRRSPKHCATLCARPPSYPHRSRPRLRRSWTIYTCSSRSIPRSRRRPCAGCACSPSIRACRLIP
jgi:hypothetical protein